MKLLVVILCFALFAGLVFAGEPSPEARARAALALRQSSLAVPSCGCGCGCVGCQCAFPGDCGDPSCSCGLAGKKLRTLWDAAAQAEAENKPLLMWVAEVCPPCEQKMSQYVHVHVKEYGGRAGLVTEPCVIVWRADHNGVLCRLATLPGIPTPEQVAKVLSPRTTTCVCPDGTICVCPEGVCPAECYSSSPRQPVFRQLIPMGVPLMMMGGGNGGGC